MKFLLDSHLLEQSVVSKIIHEGIDDFIHLMYRVSGLAAAIGVFSGLRLTTVTGAYIVRSI